MTNHSGPLLWSVELAATDSASGCAQREIWRVVEDWGLGQVADVVELVALELVSVTIGAVCQNVVRARYRDLLAVRSFALRFQLAPQGLVIATWDSNPQPPRLRRAADADDELYFVPMLAAAWDFFQSGSGKVVWAEIPVPAAGEQWLPRRGRTSVKRPTAPLVRDIALLERVRSCLRELPGTGSDETRWLTMR